LLATLFGMCFFEFFTMQTVYFHTQWHFTVLFIGFLMALNGGLIAATEMIIVHSLEGKRHGMIYITLGVMVAGIGYTLLNLLPHDKAAAIFIVILITLGEMLSMPFMNSFWISRTNLNNRGEYAGLYTMSWSTAQVLGPFFGAEVIAYGGFNLLWWLLGGVSLLTAIGYLLMYWVNYRTK